MKRSEFNQHRKKRLISMTSKKPQDKERFLKILKLNCSYETFIDIKAFSEEIEKQDYSHGKLSKAQYMAHPYRIAYTLIEHFPAIDKSYIKLALCHNILEVSEINDNLSSYLGDELVDHVTVLTVDRSVQWEPFYKKTYYEKIGKKKITRIIKIFDKFDNLFILSENKDKKTKVMYLEEIENHLMPLIKIDVPNLEDCFKSLIKINYELINETS